MSAAWPPAPPSGWWILGRVTAVMDQSWCVQLVCWWIKQPFQLVSFDMKCLLLVNVDAFWCLMSQSCWSLSGSKAPMHWWREWVPQQGAAKHLKNTSHIPINAKSSSSFDVFFQLDVYSWIMVDAYWWLLLMADDSSNVVKWCLLMVSWCWLTVNWWWLSVFGGPVKEIECYWWFSHGDCYWLK